MERATDILICSIEPFDRQSDVARGLEEIPGKAGKPILDEDKS